MADNLSADYYEILGVAPDATLSEIKRAFRKKAKKFHPDITGEPSADMRRLLDAYEVLSDRERRAKYDDIFGGPRGPRPESKFDYRAFLKERADKPEYLAKLIFFQLFNFEEDGAVSSWEAAGGLDFPLEDLLDREDWMDSGFILAEELERRGAVYESFLILIRLLAEERKRPYFRHFTEDVELMLKDIVRLKLRRAVSDETLARCMLSLTGLGFDAKDEARWLKSASEAFLRAGDKDSACAAFAQARLRDAEIKPPRKLGVRPAPA